MHTNCPGLVRHPGSTFYFGDGSGRDSYVIDMKHGWERVPQWQRKMQNAGFHKEWAYRKDYMHEGHRRPGKLHNHLAMIVGWREYPTANLHWAASSSVPESSAEDQETLTGSKLRDQAMHQTAALTYAQHTVRKSRRVPIDLGEARARLESTRSPE